MSAGEVIKCRAAVSWGANEPLVIEEVEVAPPKSGEVRVKIVATGICFTDISASRGKILDVHFPVVLGHEASGIVESVGEGVTSVAVGDHVITLFLPQCKKCRVCKLDDANTCLEFTSGTQSRQLMEDETTRITCKGKQLLQFLGVSSFSEYTVLKEYNLVKINPAAPLDVAALLSCGFPTGYGGSVKTAAVKPDSVCAVWGLGGIGLATVLGCKHRGAKTIIGIDLNDAKREIAAEMGVTDFINPKEVEGPMDKYLNDKFGCVDYTFECIGNMYTVKQSLECAAIGNGTCVLIGVPPQELELNILPIHFLLGKKLTGELFGSFKGRDEVPGLVEKYLDGKLPLDKFITHRIKLEQVNEGYDMMKEGKCLRCVIKNE